MRDKMMMHVQIVSCIVITDNLTYMTFLKILLRVLLPCMTTSKKHIRSAGCCYIRKKPTWREMMNKPFSWTLHQKPACFYNCERQDDAACANCECILIQLSEVVKNLDDYFRDMQSSFNFFLQLFPSSFSYISLIQLCPWISFSIFMRNPWQ